MERSFSITIAIVFFQIVYSYPFIILKLKKVGDLTHYLLIVFGRNCIQERKLNKLIRS